MASSSKPNLYPGIDAFLYPGTLSSPDKDFAINLPGKSLGGVTVPAPKVGPGNVLYQSELIRTLREANKDPLTNNPGVKLLDNPKNSTLTVNFNKPVPKNMANRPPVLKINPTDPTPPGGNNNTGDGGGSGPTGPIVIGPGPGPYVPTFFPTVDPTIDPTIDPTFDPTTDPSIYPTVDPTADPTTDPTIYPTVDPTIDPTIDPTVDPSIYPTIDPTFIPSYGSVTPDPTVDPTFIPSYGSVTPDPTFDPTFIPSYGSVTPDPTFDPTFIPSYGSVTPGSDDPLGGGGSDDSWSEWDDWGDDVVDVSDDVVDVPDYTDDLWGDDTPVDTSTGIDLGQANDLGGIFEMYDPFENSSPIVFDEKGEDYSTNFGSDWLMDALFGGFDVFGGGGGGGGLGGGMIVYAQE